MFIQSIRINVFIEFRGKLANEAAEYAGGPMKFGEVTRTSPRGDVHRYAVVRGVRIGLRRNGVDRSRVRDQLGGAGHRDGERNRSLVARTAARHVMERAHHALTHRAAPIWIGKSGWRIRGWICGALNHGRADIGERRRQRIHEDDSAERAPRARILDLIGVGEGGTY